MKKRLSLAGMVLLAFTLFALTACGGSSKKDLSDSKYVGTWKATEVALLDESEGLGGEWLLVLNGDGSGQSISNGETTQFTWELTNNGFKTKGDVDLKFTDNGDNIEASLFGVKLVFEKQ